jgi:hypothetical protein
LFADFPGWRHGDIPCGETVHAAGQSTVRTKVKNMGDKSPKAVNKQATQKHNKAESAQQKKQQAVTAKQVAGKKK